MSAKTGSQVEQLLRSLEGQAMPPATIVIERGPVAEFAAAVTDGNPVYRDPEAAGEHGLDAIPVPPTYPIAMPHWGSFPELQPEGADAESPLTELVEQAVAAGKLLLHGEQEFVYHRPIVVGDRLHATGEIEDVYSKEGKVPMSFVVARTDWADDDGELVLTTRFTAILRG